MMNKEDKKLEKKKLEKKKRVVELLGGVGSGKSRILEILESQYDAQIIQADQVAKDLEKKGQPGYEGLVKQFGQEILQEDGEIDKAKLAAVIFSDEKAMWHVNRIIHPLVWQEIKRWVEEKESGLIVVETALPDKKTGDIYDEVWYVYTLRETRIRRLMESRGYSKERCISMMENQPDTEEYWSLADYTIDNSKTLEETEEQIRQLLGHDGE